ncbi:MAG: hypothetical protein ACREIM_04700 [Nitrospiraceae bacterium]
MTECTWTNVVPMMAGFYWFRDSTGVHLGNVFQSPDGFMVILLPLKRPSVVDFLLRTPIPLCLIKGEWVGPVAPP